LPTTRSAAPFCRARSQRRTAALRRTRSTPPPPPAADGGGGGGGGSARPPIASQTSFYEAGGEEEGPSDLAVDLDALPPNVKQVKEMFPDLPIPAIQAALQKASVQQVIEAALAGQVDPDAVPSDTSAGSKNSGSPGLSGSTVPLSEAKNLFPPDVYPSRMLPRDLMRLQDLFPDVPTSLLQAELHVTGSLDFSTDTLVTGQVHAEVMAMDPVPVALRGFLIKSDPGGKNFQRRFFILRQLTGSLCYARLPEDMSNPLGVVYLFNSRLSGAKDSAAGVLAKFPNVDANSGLSLVTPHRTYQLFAESDLEANAWKSVLQQMQMMMVPDEFQTGDDTVECEVFENQRYGMIKGWGPHFMPGERLTYSNRKGELSSLEFPDVRLPNGFIWEDEWRIDTTYAHTDPDGWCYAGSFASIEADLEHGTSNPTNRTFDVTRRRRWLRTSKRLAAKQAGQDNGVSIDYSGKGAGASPGETELRTGANQGLAGADEDAFGLKDSITDAGL